MFLLIQFPPVQTWLVHRATSILSEKLQTRVEVKSVNISFFNKLVLNGVYIQDIDNDTLLYTSRIAASIKKLPIFGNSLSVRNLTLSDGEFHLKSDTTGTNIALLIQRLSDKNKQKDTTKSSSPLLISVEGIELRNFAFTFTRDTGEEQLPHNQYSIDFKDIDVDSLHLAADNIRIVNDTLFYNVKSFALKEKSGYRLQQLSADCYIVPGKDVHFNNLKITDDYSDINLRYYSMTYENGEEFKDFVNNVVLSGEFDNAKISVKSIGYFAASMQNIPIAVTVNGKINGPVANLKSNVTIDGLSNTHINGRFGITGLPDINESIIFADFKQLRTNPSDVANALEKITGSQVNAMKGLISNIQYINFKGSFSGLYNDFVANGLFATDLGQLKLDVLFKTDDKRNVGFKGRLSTPLFEAGKLLNTDLIGHVGFNLMTEVKMPRNGQLDVFGEGIISELLFNGYKYENIKLSGAMKNKEFNGSVNVNNTNIDLAFLGKINFNGTQADPAPVFDFEADLKHIDLVKLNFNKRDSISQFQGKVLANFKGDNIINYVGNIKLTDAFYTDAIERLPIGEVTLTSQELSGKSSLYFLSDFIEARYTGPYRFGDFVSELKLLAYTYVPNLRRATADTTSIVTDKTSPYEVMVKVKKMGEIMRIIKPGLYIAENSTLDLLIDTTHKVMLDVVSKKLSLNSDVIEDIKINARNLAVVPQLDEGGRIARIVPSDSLKLSIRCANATLGGISFQNIKIDNAVKNNVLSTNLSYHNTSDRKNTGNLALFTDFFISSDSLTVSQDNSPEERLAIGVAIQPSEIILNDSIWQLAPSNVLIDSSRIVVNKFKFFKNNQALEINGAISHNKNDTVKLRLMNYNLKEFNYLTQRQGYVLNGDISGTAEITGIYNTPLIMVNVNADEVKINNNLLGDVTVVSAWDNEYERLNVITRIFSDKTINTSINGYVSPKDKFLRFDIELNRLKLRYIEPLLKGIVSDINGSASGSLSLLGNFNSPALTGKINLNETSLLVDYLQTHYKVDASINFTKDQIKISNGMLYDLNNHTGRLNVTLNHNNFKNINFEAQATINNMMCLNTKVNDNPLFYGTSYATGGIRIHGTPQNIHFNITAQAEKNSTLYIPLSSTMQAKETPMLTFKRPDSIALAQTLETGATVKPKTHIDFGLDLTVNPDTEIQILIDEKAGDILRAQGQGNLKINVDPAVSLFSIVGDYQIDKGDYNFTLPNFNFISRKFNIDKGSQINFNGDITGATLNVQASYKDRVSLAPIMQDSTYGSKKYPVDCQILITGRMLRPTLKFNIEFPNLDPESKARAKSTMNTDEKMTIQFLSLLVLNSFVPEQQYGNENYGTTSVLSNATDLLSSQIGNLISMLNLPVPLDVSVDVGVDRYQQTDVEVTANMQLFDRLIINGSVGNSSRADKQWVGDWEMEIPLGAQRKYRLKAFSRSSDYFTDDLETNMQGVGVSYQTEFDNFKDLFKRKKKITTPKDSSEMKKNDKKDDSKNNSSK